MIVQEIKINNLEEIAIGKNIEDEIIISNKDNKVVTIRETNFGGSTDIIRIKYNYKLKDNTLTRLGGTRLSKEEYNYCLDLIKQSNQN